MSDTPSRPRTAGRIIVAVLFALLAANALKEVFWSDSPPTLRILQAIVGALATATAWGAWIGARWSAALAALYGLVAGGMVVSLGPMLDMPVEERGGLWIGGAVILVFSLVCAWYLRRATSRAPIDASAARPD
jgi:peptidoglycan/LPS O-acetylase OafA/YrhL